MGTCDGGSCTAPTGCSSDSDCEDMEDGLKMCNDETNQCGPEFCSDSADCISDGYVCQSSTICVPGCDDVPCDDPLECGSDGLCYIAEMCDSDEDCEDIPFAPTCINIDLGEEQLVDHICGATCNNDTDCEDIPWGFCMGGICLSNPNPDYFTNMTGMACSSSADCTDDDFPNCFNSMDIMIADGMCVPDDPDMFFDMMGMTMCNTADDCTDDMPVCVNETQMLMESGLCMPACVSDSDCGDGWECEELPASGYSVCVTTDQCTVTGNDNPCDDDQVCVPTIGKCAAICDVDDDCEGTTQCSKLPGSGTVSGLPVVGDFVDSDIVLFCDVFAMTDDPTMQPTPSPVEDVDGGDAASEIMAFGTVIAMFTTLLF